MFFLADDLLDALLLIVVVSLRPALAEVVKVLAKLNGWVFKQVGLVLDHFRLLEPRICLPVGSQDFFDEIGLFAVTSQDTFASAIFDALSDPSTLEFVVKVPRADVVGDIGGIDWLFHLEEETKAFLSGLHLTFF